MNVAQLSPVTLAQDPPPLLSILSLSLLLVLLPILSFIRLVIRSSIHCPVISIYVNKVVNLVVNSVIKSANNVTIATSIKIIINPAPTLEKQSAKRLSKIPHILRYIFYFLFASIGFQLERPSFSSCPNVS